MFPITVIACTSRHFYILITDQIKVHLYSLPAPAGISIILITWIAAMFEFKVPAPAGISIILITHIRDQVEVNTPATAGILLIFITRQQVLIVSLCLQQQAFYLSL